jgi:small-conductance mechanosensitive channel
MTHLPQPSHPRNVAGTTPVPRRLVLLAALWLVGVAGIASIRASSAFAEPAAPETTTIDQTGADHGFPLRVGGVEVFVFRGSLGASSPERRRDRTQEHLDEVLASMRRDTVGLRALPEGMLVLYGRKPLFTVLPGDLDPTLDEDVGTLAARTVAALEQAIPAALQERRPSFMLVQLALVALVTVLYLGLLRLLVLGRERLGDLLLSASERRLARLEASGLPRTATQYSSALIQGAVTALTSLFALGMVYSWLVFTLRRFPSTRPWGDGMRDLLWTRLGMIGHAVVGALPELLTVSLIFLIARWVTHIIGAFFTGVERGSVRLPGFHADTAAPTRRIAQVLLWIAALMAAYPYLPGSDSDVFKGISVFLGVIISLGSSGIMNQLMSGLVIMYSRAFRPGDLIRVGDVEGTVTQVGVLSTKVMTRRREEVTLPNSVVVASGTTNYSRLAEGAGAIVTTRLTIGYDAPWRQVHALLELAASRTPGVRKQPAPFVLQPALSDFYVEYVLGVSVDRPDQRYAVLSALHANIQDAFNEYGVQIMSPNYEADRDQPTVVPPERWYAAPASPPAVGHGAGPAGAGPGPPQAPPVPGV